MNDIRPGVFGRRAGPFADRSANRLAHQPRELSVDINELFYRHQLALMAAGRPRSASARRAAVDLSGHYADRIEAYRARRGMSKYFHKARPPAAPIIGA